MQANLALVQPVAPVSVRYRVEAIPKAWVLLEDKVPESVPHDDAAEYIRDVLLAWANHSRRSVRIVRNFAIRWIETHPQIGIDPDVAVLEPRPPGADDLNSLLLWKPGMHPPRLCFEVVSQNHPHKDYAEIQDRYAAMGAEELVVFDPLLAGPTAHGGPVALQLWRRTEDGAFTRVAFGNDPAYCHVLDAWLVPDGRHLRIKDTRDAPECWPTREERERAKKERALAEKERALAEKEALVRRIAELEADADHRR